MEASNSVSAHNMLVCVDRTDCEVAWPIVCAIAETFDSVTLLHVMQSPAQSSRACDVIGWEIARREAAKDLARLQEQATQRLGKPVAIRLEQGPPAERIADLAREFGSGLIVLSSRRADGVTALNLVQRVLALAGCSVFIVHAYSSARDAAPPKRVLVPLDGSLRTESVLPRAARIARAYGADLLLVHIIKAPIQTRLFEPADFALAQQLAGQLDRSGQRYLEHLKERMARDGTHVRCLVGRHVSTGQGLLQVAERESADLVILSAHGAGNACSTRQLFGSVTIYLLRHSRLPLLVLQDLP
jgi:nucleotide-binding universal stress UspA family protein